MLDDVVTLPPSITVRGDVASRGGCYLLRIAVLEVVKVRFGHFLAGELVEISAGDYLYIGSAMGQWGSSSLARRLLRHATRCDKRPFHAIRPILQSAFVQASLADLPLHPPKQKKRHWHIDYLLDETAVSLQHVTVFRSFQRLESPFATALLADSATHILQSGLGASDDPGGTHLLGVVADSDWWESLPNWLLTLQQEKETHV